jgi:hypothetical protein
MPRAACVTPSFKGKIKCIDHVCIRIKLHTLRRCEYQNQCHTNKELLHDQSLKRNINNEFSQRIKCLHRQLTEGNEHLEVMEISGEIFIVLPV